MDNALVGETRRVAGGLFIGSHTLTPGVLAPSAVTGLIRGVVWTPPPKSCPLQIVPNSHPAYEEHRQAFLEMSGREIKQSIGKGGITVAKVELPSGTLIRDYTKPAYRYPGRIRLDLAPEAAKVWAEFLNYFPGGLVDIDPDSVVSLHPASNYNRLPGLLGLAQFVSDGTLEMTGTPDDLSIWWDKVGDDWIDLESASRLGQAVRSAVTGVEDWKWWQTWIARATDYTLPNNPESTLHGNGFRLDGNIATIEDANGDWVSLEKLAFIIRRPFTLPPASPSPPHQPVFLLPGGVPEPAGPFGRYAPLLREVVE